MKKYQMTNQNGEDTEETWDHKGRNMTWDSENHRSRPSTNSNLVFLTQA